MRSSLLRLAFLLAACSPAAAQSGRDEAVAWCEGRDVAHAQAIAGCTWLIESGSEGFRGTAAAHGRRGGARWRAGDRAGALKDYTAAVGFDPRNPAVWIDRGRALQNFDPDRAAADFSEAIRLAPNHAAAHRLRADAKRAAGDTKGAIADYTEAVRLDPRSAEAFYLRGFTRREQGDWKGALADYDEAIRLRPRYADAYALRSTARRALGDTAGGWADIEEALRIEPDNLLGINNRGFIRYEDGDLAGAAADHGRAIDIDPTFVRAWRGRGNARRYLGDTEGAIADYTEAIRLDPGHADSRISRAFVRRAAGDLEGALDDYLAARRLPDAEGVLANLCITRFRLGQREEALLDCRMAQSEAAAGDGRPYATEAGVLLLAGDHAGAEAALEEALRRDPRSAHALRLRSVLRAKRGDAAAADRDIAAAQEIAPWMERLVRDAYGHALFR